jgi:hypothetical protein
MSRLIPILAIPLFAVAAYFASANLPPLFDGTPVFLYQREAIAATAGLLAGLICAIVAWRRGARLQIPVPGTQSTRRDSAPRAIAQKVVQAERNVVRRPASEIVLAAGVNEYGRRNVSGKDPKAFIVCTVEPFEDRSVKVVIKAQHLTGVEFKNTLRPRISAISGLDRWVSSNRSDEGVRVLEVTLLPHERNVVLSKLKDYLDK